MKKVEIRKVRQSDVSGILEIYAPCITGTNITFEEEVPSEADFWDRVQRICQNHPYLVCEMDGRVAGYAYISEYRSRASYRWTKEITVYVHPDFYRKRVAHALYTSLLEIARAQGISDVLAIITIPNNPSIYFHEFFGFRKCGEFKNVGYKMGQWQTVGWWELFLQDETKPPCKHVLSPGEVEKLPVFKSALLHGEALLKV
jgi:phosphinothricin acetyltransferase